MAVDGRALHGIDRHPRASPQRRRRIRARLSISVHVRCRRETLGLRGSMQLGRGAQALARAGAAQRGDGRPLPGELRQVPGTQMSPHPALPHRGRETALQERIWLALAEINDPEMPVSLVDLGLIYGLTVV